MSKYEEMTDFEINKLVGERRGLYIADNIFLADFCNNPLAAWPIILEYKIGIDTIGFKGGEDRVWWAELTFNEYGDHHYAEDKNPLRAAMIVYLMLEEV